MNSYGYEEYKISDEQDTYSTKIISLLKQNADGSTDILIKALQCGEWKLNHQEIHHVLSNPENIKDYLMFRYAFFRSMNEIPKSSRFPIYAIIEPASVCNLKCTMCFQQDTRLHTPPFGGGYVNRYLFKRYRSIVKRWVQGYYFCRKRRAASK